MRGCCCFWRHVSLPVGCLEVGARVVWKHKYNNWLARQLHGFDYVDRKRGIVIPTPNTSKTVARFREDLESHGKTMGLTNFEESIQSSASPDSAVLFRINKLGFKGPEITLAKPDSVLRVLTLGNSCTWGPPNEYYTYPRVMERELGAMLGVNEICCVEVINAGVLGYNFERVMKRIDEFMAVDPDIVTIYLGWNRTIARADPAKNQFLYRNLTLYKFFYHTLLNREDTGLTSDYQSRTYYDDQEGGLSAYAKYDFGPDIKDLAKLVGMIHERRPAAQIVIVTLAGLFDWRVQPDAKALQAGHPIAATQNLYGSSLFSVGSRRVIS